MSGIVSVCLRLCRDRLIRGDEVSRLHFASLVGVYLVWCSDFVLVVHGRRVLIMWI